MFFRSDSSNTLNSIKFIKFHTHIAICVKHSYDTVLQKKRTKIRVLYNTGMCLQSRYDKFALIIKVPSFKKITDTYEI
jgi:hypothetical protein